MACQSEQEDEARFALPCLPVLPCVMHGGVFECDPDTPCCASQLELMHPSQAG